MYSLAEPTRCYIISINGCYVRECASLNSALIFELPYRCVVLVDGIDQSNDSQCKKVARVHIIEPFKGFLSLKCIDIYPANAPEPIFEPANEQSAHPLFIASSTFTGPRLGAFFGTDNQGRIGYHRDPLQQIVFTTLKQGTKRSVLGLHGARVRSGPQLWFPIIGVLPRGTIVQVDTLFQTSRVIDGTEIKINRVRIGPGRWISEQLLSKNTENDENNKNINQHIITNNRSSICHKLVDSGLFHWRFNDECKPEPLTEIHKEELDSDFLASGLSDPALWLAKKLALKQDALFFVSNDRRNSPCWARNLAREAATRTGRGIEFLTLHCDITEADLKQRPELIEGTLVYIDQPPLRAAKSGSILLLDGLDSVEANVLPALNNLLAFRQIALDDGTFLTADPQFAVVAIAYGPITEPTLRSRFSAHQLFDSSKKNLIHPIAAKLAETLDAVDAPSRPDASALTAKLNQVLASNPNANVDYVLQRAYPHRLFVRSRRHCELLDRVYTGVMSAASAEESILEDLKAGLPTLIVGPRECGKSFLAQKIANKVQATIILCHEDLRTRDLLQDHQLDNQVKSTSWHSSKFLECVRNGGLILLEEIDCLPKQLLPILRGILVDGILPDGTPIHNNFRLIATAIKVEAELAVSFQTHVLQTSYMYHSDPRFDIYTTAINEVDTLRDIDLVRIGATLATNSETFNDAITPVIEYARLALSALQVLAAERAIGRAKRGNNYSEVMSKKDILAHQHILLCGTQGVGKNLLAAKIFKSNYVYIQLGRDSTIAQLLVSISLSRGALDKRDAPFLDGVHQGKNIVIDEADKAPHSVLRFLRAIAMDHDIELGDGRTWRQVRSSTYRLVVLANPTSANNRVQADAFLELRGAFYPLIVKSPDFTQLTRTKLSDCMADRLVIMFQALISANTGYPYSARDIVKVAEHCTQYADEIDDLIPALLNVTTLDDAIAPIRFKIDSVLEDDAGVKANRHEDELGEEELLHWMVQKAELRQHIGLLCEPPCTYGRRLALRFCALINRPVECLNLTVDTTEADLIQRRELVDGSIIFVDQAPIRAARQGAILLVRGLHLVNSNVISTLHNLLEHQTLALTDGTSIKPNTISSDFLVIAIHHSVSKFQTEGRDLDPALRSRFAWHSVATPSTDDQLGRFIKLLRANWDPTSITELDPKLPDWRRREILHSRQAQIIQRWPPRNDSIVKLIATFPTLHFSSIIRRTCQKSTNFELILERADLKTKDEEPLLEFALGPRPIFEYSGVKIDKDEVDDDGLTRSQRRQVSGGHFNLLAKAVALSQDDLSTTVAHVVFDDGSITRAVTGQSNLQEQILPGVTLSGSQRRILSAMLQDHCAGVDIHLVGEKGVGKMTIVREFAAALGYQRPRIIMCHGEMIAMDLLARRSTDGSTSKWLPGPVVEAAVHGELLVFDGVHRLPRGFLAAVLEPLITDRMLHLPDGTRLGSTGNECIHIDPAFRIISISCDEQQSDWIGLFHVHNVPPWSYQEKFEFLSQEGIPQTQVRELLAYGEACRLAAQSELALLPLLLTTRNLVAVAIAYKECKSIKASVNRVFAGFHRDKIRESLVNETLTTAAGNSQENTIPALLQNLKIRQSIAPCVRLESNSISIGDVEFQNSCPTRTTKQFVDIDLQQWLLRDLLVDWKVGKHILVIGSQGVGKNIFIERFLDIMGRDRDYLHLHRDATFAWLTSARRLRANALIIEDPPLVRAAIMGHVLVVDEIDKAPPEILYTLRALALGRDLNLADGRRLIYSGSGTFGARDDIDQKDLRICDRFRIVLLANQSGYPFTGRDVYREIGDVFATHRAPRFDRSSQIRLLRAYGRHVPVKTIAALCAAWDELQQLYEIGRLTYSVSPREAIKILVHLNKFQNDDPMQVIEDVLAFDAFDTDLHDTLKDIVHRHFSPDNPPAAPTISTTKTVATHLTEKRIYAEARRASLHEAQTTDAEARAYQGLLEPSLKRQIAMLQSALDQRRQQTRTGRWLRFQPRGDLDEHAIVECALGSERIYKYRERIAHVYEPSMVYPAQRTRIALVLDLSGSMYTKDNVDGRLRRCVECALLVIEACRDLHSEYDYAIFGHSGSTSALELVSFGSPPATIKDTLRIVQRMIEHARTCKSGDKTIAAVRRALKAILKAPAKEYLLFLISDADFASSYGESILSLNAALTAEVRVATVALFVASDNRAHIEALCRELPVGRGAACYDTEDLVSSLRQAFLCYSNIM